MNKIAIIIISVFIIYICYKSRQPEIIMIPNVGTGIYYSNDENKFLEMYPKSPDYKEYVIEKLDDIKFDVEFIEKLKNTKLKNILVYYYFKQEIITKENLFVLNDVIFLRITNNNAVDGVTVYDD